MLIIITLILAMGFLLNLIAYWIVYLKTQNKKSKFWARYTKIFLGIYSSTLLSIPITSSSFLTAVSYFKQYWIWFLLLGIVFVAFGIKLGRMAITENKNRGLEKGKYPLVTKGAYHIMRHPMYSAWALVFLGLSFICDSFLALLLAPLFMLVLGIESFLEEKFLLLPKFKEQYEKYKNETPNRLFPPPYNALLVIIAILIIYIGFINFFL